MANLGPRDTGSLVMLTGWDATELQNWRLQDGTTIDRVYSELTAALGAQSRIDDQSVGQSDFIQDNPDVEYRVGASNGFGRTPVRCRTPSAAATEGHMLPYVEYDRMLGWTWDYLRRARMEQVQADIADAKTARDNWRQKILTRLLKRADDSEAS